MIEKIEFIKMHDRKEYIAALNMLSTDGKFFRFGYVPTEYSIDSFVNNLDMNYHIVYMVYCDSNLAGHFHIGNVRDGERPEVALALRDEYQGRGIGKLMLSNAIDILKSKNIKDFYMCCLSRNPKVIGLIKSLRCEVDIKRTGSEAEALIKICF